MGGFDGRCMIRTISSREVYRNPLDEGAGGCDRADEREAWDLWGGG